MSNRSWFCLLLGASLSIVLPRGATAQFIHVLQDPAANANRPPKQSHHSLPNEPDMQRARELMFHRLRELRELHQLQEEVRDLLQDQDFLDKIKKHFPPEQLQQLRERLLTDEAPRGDNEWNTKFWQAVEGGKLKKRQKDILIRWANRVGSKPPKPPDNLSLQKNRAPSPPSSPPAARGSSSDPETPSRPASPPERSFWDRWSDESAKWLSENVENLGDDMVHALDEMGTAHRSAPLAEVFRAMKQADFPSDDLAKAATGLVRYLPNMGELLNEQRSTWEEISSLFRAVPSSSLAEFNSFSSASALSATAPTNGDWNAAPLTLLVLGAFLLVVWKLSGWSKAREDFSDSDVWRLGGWPVMPDAVATRRDLVRAFEHLALLCLGPQASTHNHRQLADRLIEQDGGDPARRQAVELLTWLYEQARYAPAGESLSPEELSDARQALGYLAGVTTV